MYKNFNLSDEERKQILEQHKSYGYRKPLNEDVEMDEQWYKDAYNKVVGAGKSALNVGKNLANAALHPIDTYNRIAGTQTASPAAATKTGATASADPNAPAGTAPAKTGGTTAGTTTGGTAATAPTNIKDVLKGSYIRSGMRGEAVKQLQDAINALNMSGVKVSVDGIFGPETLGAVEKVQKSLGVKPKNGQYGIFGAITYNAMIKALQSGMNDNTKTATAPPADATTTPADATPAAPQTPTAPTTPAPSPYSNLEV